MRPSNSVFSMSRDYPLPDDLNCANFTGVTETHQPGGRAQPVTAEKYQFAALTIVNMEKRGVDSLDHLTKDKLRQPGTRAVEYCISEPIGLHINTDKAVTWAHVLDHSWIGLEPLMFYTMKMGELPPRLTDKVWKDATRRPDNLLPLMGPVHKHFDSGQAASVPTPRALKAYALGNEEDLADRLVQQGEDEGTFRPNPDDWELRPGDAMVGAHYQDVEYRVGKEQRVKQARSHEYDWWRFPRAEVPEAEDAGFYYPGEGLTRSVVERPGESWRQSVPLKFDGRARPAFQTFVRPGKALWRFVWQVYARAASGEPLSFSNEGQAVWNAIKYKLALECARDWRTLAAALHKRPQAWPPLSARLQYVRDHPNMNSGRRIWPALDVNVTTSARRTSRKRPHGDSDDESDSGRGQGPSRRPAPPTRTTSASTSSSAAAGSASSSSSTSSSSSSSPSATRQSSAPTLAEDASSARITLEEEHFETFVRIMLFLEQRVVEGTLEVEDTCKGWSHIAGKLPGPLCEEAEELVRHRRRLDQEIRELEEEEMQQRVDESLRRVSQRSQSPVEHFRRRMAGNVRCQTSPSPRQAADPYENDSPRSPTESF